MPLFCKSYSEEKRERESIKEADWKRHFFDYGRLVYIKPKFILAILGSNHHNLIDTKCGNDFMLSK